MSLSPAQLDAIHAFLPCRTPDAWIEAALTQQTTLLIDHANCEKKAAATAMSLMYRHTGEPQLLSKMSQLAREELLHFQQVVELMAARGITYTRLSSSRYAGALHELIRPDSTRQLADTLLVGAYIEARSCERFACLAPHLDDELGRFYTSLLRSEGRHYQDYLDLGRHYLADDEEFAERLRAIATVEEALITSPDVEFRFHSGLPPT